MELFSFLDTQTVFTIIHVLGAILGAGAALTSDFLFSSAVSDGRVGKGEMRLLTAASRAVWGGIALLILSGVVLFWINFDAFIQSPRMLAKLTLVGVVIGNGILFHTKHLPELRKRVDAPHETFHSWIRSSRGMFMSGAISTVSWLSVVVLGLLHTLPLSYGTIFLFYLGALMFALAGSQFARMHLIRSHGDTEPMPKAQQLIAIFLALAFVFLSAFVAFGPTLSQTIEEPEHSHAGDNAHD